MKIERMISKYNFSKGNTFKYIVIHDTGNYTDTAKNNALYFNGGNRQASAHYFVDDTSIYQVVEDFNASWHCGDGYNKYGVNNYNSIGIEMCRVKGTVTKVTEDKTVELVKMLMSKYYISADRVIRHYDASRKTCPSSFSANNWERWNNFKLKLSPQKPVVAPPKPPTVTPSKFTYANNAVALKRVSVYNERGGLLSGRYVDANDKITVLGVNHTNQLVHVQYPIPTGVYTAYIKNDMNVIKYTYQSQWVNGSTSETVYDENGKSIGLLYPREKATPLYRKGGKLHLVYNTSNGSNSKSGYVVWNGGFNKF